jgi:hypothetical protein
MDAESQNFLPDYHLDKKKYETDYVSAVLITYRLPKLSLMVYCAFT